MQTDENWAVSIERIREFFRSQADVTETEYGFCFKSCRITLTALPGIQIGIFSAPRTQIRIEGAENDLREIHRRFFLRFLSAGG